MPHNSTRLLANQSTVTTGTAGAGTTGFLAMFASANTLQQAAAQSSGTQILFSDGLVGAPSIGFINDTTTGFFRISASAIGATAGGTQALRIDGGGTIINDGLSYRLGSAADVIIARDQAAILAIKNGATAQSIRVYGTTVNSNFVQLTHNGTNGIITTSGGLFGFGTVTSSTGTNTASSPSPVTGFITITDSAGVSRKLLTGT
jgi:hypothetical protein